MVEVERLPRGSDPSPVQLFPDRESSFSLIARLVGWIAHAQEQMVSGPMLRLRTAYTGPLPDR